ncbi:MAG TPA: YceI family protein [Niastella sp.]
MKTSTSNKLIILTVALLAIGSITRAQIKYQSVGGVKLVIEGTSNIHDWDMKSDKGYCSSIFDISNTGTLNGVSFINFTVPAESLKSERKGLDKNTYKALNTAKYASITFTASSVTVKPAGSASYFLTARGRLTISNVTKDVVLTANGVMNSDKSITYSGSYRLKMTDYNVEPPTLMMGAIKTGDLVTVKFNLLLRSI